jgi:hypothetical protein
MATSFDVTVSGAKAQTAIVPPVNGKDGLPLGAAGNGANGQADAFHKCTMQAGPGLPGNPGIGAPPANSGANGGDAYSVIITCSQYAGDPLALLNNGGDGADASSGGNGGNGSDGGNAGTQPKGCTQTIAGGVGGGAGQGGNAGSGGKAGNAGDIVVIYGSSFTSVPISATSNGGNPGKFGQPGLPGTPGKGGLGSDGTAAGSGGAAGGGAFGKGGDGGYGGSFNATQDSTKPSGYLKISVQTPPAK